MALTRITKGVIKPNENYDTQHINSTGIVTAIGLDINGNGDISGNLSVGGVLTYEDVTSIDSVGIITAQSDIHVGAGLSVAGIGTFNSDIHLGQFVVHKGDTTTHFGFDVPNQIEFTAGNNERLRITNSGNVHFAGDQSGVNRGIIYNGPGYFGLFGSSSGSTKREIRFHSSSSGSDETLRISTGGNVAIYADLDVDGHTNLDNVSVAGVSTFSDNVILAEQKELRLEPSGAFKLYRGAGGGGATNFIKSTFGSISVEAANSFIAKVNNNEDAIAAYANDRVDLHYNNQIKLTTASSGVNVSGTTTTTGLAVTGVSTFTGNIDANGDLDVDGHTNLDNLSIAGVTTGTTINATTFVGNLTGNVTGNADTATTTERVTLTNQGGDSTCNVLFAQSATGNQLPHTNANLTFNATNGRLTATSFAGDGSNLTGITQTTINSNTNNYLITGTGTANTLQGESSFRYDGNGGLDMEGTGSAFFQIKTPDSTDGGIYFRTGTTNYGAISYLHNSTPSLGRMNFRSGGTTKMDLVGAGHLGVGANNLTKTWSLGKAIHIGDSENAIWGEADYAVHLMQNAYYNSGYKHTHSDEATLYSQEDGTHRFKVTASGSADSAITWTEALRIRSDGNIGINNVGDASWKLKIVVPDNASYQNAFNVTNNANSDFNVNIKSNLTAIGNGTNKPLAIFTNGNSNPRIQITEGGSVNVGGDFTQSTYTMKVTGSFAATTKSFVIDHPTKENHQLRYACLEGPENSVYVRGKTSDSVIELPDYWKGLVHEDSITVNVTPIGNHKVWVETINNNSVTIGSDGTEYFYTVFAERKDVDKLEVEVAK